MDRSVGTVASEMKLELERDGDHRISEKESKGKNAKEKNGGIGDQLGSKRQISLTCCNNVRVIQFIVRRRASTFVVARLHEISFVKLDWDVNRGANTASARECAGHVRVQPHVFRAAA